MSDLIYREDAKDYVRHAWSKGINPIEYIDAIPAADVVERKRGEWYCESDGYADGELVYDMWSGPICGKRFYEWEEKPDWNFCPNCGSSMEG